MDHSDLLPIKIENKDKVYAMHVLGLCIIGFFSVRDLVIFLCFCSLYSYFFYFIYLNFEFVVVRFSCTGEILMVLFNPIRPIPLRCHLIYMGRQTQAAKLNTFNTFTTEGFSETRPIMHLSKRVSQSQ